jgi:hypothetical protein
MTLEGLPGLSDVPHTLGCLRWTLGMWISACAGK